MLLVERRGNNFTSLVVFLQLASDTKISHATRVITAVKTTNLFTIVAHIVNTLGQNHYVAISKASSF